PVPAQRRGRRRGAIEPSRSRCRRGRASRGADSTPTAARPVHGARPLGAGTAHGMRAGRRNAPAQSAAPAALDMRLYERILGHPFVYDHVRPRVVGGIDMSPVYDRLGAGAGSSVLDIGCGTGDALNYLHAVERYVGIDLDP